MHIKPEDMSQFDVFHTFVENSVKSEFLFFSKEPKSKIHQKTSMFEQIKNQVLVESCKGLIHDHDVNFLIFFIIKVHAISYGASVNILRSPCARSGLALTILKKRSAV